MAQVARLIRDGRVLTMCDEDGGRPPAGGRRGRALGTLGVRAGHDVLVVDGRIAEVTPTGEPASDLRRSLGGEVEEIAARGLVVMPGFVDCHTHACFAGSRIDEWERKLGGASYLEILASGGGIMSTVGAVARADAGELACDLLSRLDRMLAAGTTTAEVKSGYGLSREVELRMLEAITGACEYTPVGVVATALLGHAVPAGDGAEGFVRETIEATLPAVSAAHPGIAVDAYCESGAWSVRDTVELLTRARALGHPVRVHADQFNALGMLEEAVRLGARSVDHLEASTSQGLAVLAASETFGVMLPACGFHLDGRFARGREFVDAGGLLAIASNYNPGSAPCFSMSMVIALAVRHLGLSAAEAIGAATVNPAALLGFADRGYIAPGARADVLVLEHDDERGLAYEFGAGAVRVAMVGGRVIE